MFIFSSGRRLNLIYYSIFSPLLESQSHRNKDRHIKETQGGGGGNKGRSGLVVFVLKNLPEETRQRSGSKLQKKREEKEAGLDGEGIVRCSLFLLWVGEVKEKFESWSRNQKCQQIESEQSWDRLEGESINTDGGPCRILGASLG